MRTSRLSEKNVSKRRRAAEKREKPQREGMLGRKQAGTSSDHSSMTPEAPLCYGLWLWSAAGPVAGDIIQGDVDSQVSPHAPRRQSMQDGLEYCWVMIKDATMGRRGRGRQGR